MLFVATFSVNRRAAFAGVVFAYLVVTHVNTSAAEPPPARRWTDAANGRMIEAQFLGLNGEKIRLRTLDGKVWELLPERLIQADRDFVQQAIAAKADVASIGALASPSGRSEVQIPPKGQEPLPSAQVHGKEVVVTGVGVDPEKALQDAFSRAIEQIVGVLVDAETVVKNDQLIRDEILTYSRGYVEKYEIVKRREDGGLHKATIRATVSPDKLVQKLKEMKVAMQDVAGEIAARQFEFDAKNEQQAAEMFEKALAGFQMTKLTKVEIIGKPDITREGDNAKVRICVTAMPDYAQWQEFSRDLRALLAKISSNRAGVSAMPGSTGEIRIVSVGGTPLKRQLAGQGALVGLFVKANGKQTQWELFRVPESIRSSVERRAKDSYHLVYALLDSHDATVLRVEQPIESHDGGQSRLGPIHGGSYTTDMSDFGHEWTWWIGPVFLGFTIHNNDVTRYEADNTVTISADDLRKVAKVVVFLDATKS
jgi:hypothetical protein